MYFRAVLCFALALLTIPRAQAPTNATQTTAPTEMALIESLPIPPRPEAHNASHSGMFLPYSYFANKTFGTLFARLDAIAVADFNHDGRNDVALLTLFNPDYYQESPDDAALFIFLQNAQGVLQEPVRYATAFNSRTRGRSIAAGDVNGDGRADLVIGNFDSLEIFTQTAQGTLTQSSLIRTPFAVCVKLGDVNGDGRTDLVSAGWELSETKLVVWAQNSQGELSSPEIHDVPKSNGNEIEIGDLNGDGRKDVALLNFSGYENNDLLIYHQNAAGKLQAPVPYEVNILNCSGFAIGDVTGDNRADVAVSFGGNNAASPQPGMAILVQNQSGTLNAPVNYPTLDAPQPVEIGDVNGDGRLDVITAHYGWENVGVYLQGSDGNLWPEELYPIPHNLNGHNAQGLVIADINSDGQQDVLVSDNYQRKLVLLYHQTPGEVPPDITITSPNGGENLVPGTTHKITWNSTSSVKRVRIAYLQDGINYIPITDNAPNTGSIDWVVPDKGSSNTVIRIVDETGRAWDTNDEYFNIQSCQATLTPLRHTYMAGGGLNQIMFLALGAGCDWQATADVNWITFPAFKQGKGSATIYFAVNGGSDTSPRTGTITVAGAKITITQAGVFTTVSGAHYRSPVAPESIVSGFGQQLATGTDAPKTLPLPASLLGTTIKVRDVYGVERLAPLFYVSPNQVNYQVPPGTAVGPALVTITSGDGKSSVGTLIVEPAAYGIFSADATGSGPAAAYAVRVKGGEQTVISTVRYDEAQKKWLNVPLDVSKPDEEIFLILHGTGVRFRNPATPVRVIFGSQSLEAEYAGPQGYFVGLDQINVKLPKSLQGLGEMSLIFFVNDRYANNVSVHVQ